MSAAARICATLFVAWWVALLLVPATLAEQPDNRDAAAVRAVREAATKAEVHGVGISTPAVSYMVSQDVTDWPGLVTALRLQKGGAGRVRSLLSEDTRKVIDEEGIVEKFAAPKSDSAAHNATSQLRARMLRELNEVVNRRDFSRGSQFDDVAIDDDTKALIALDSKRTAYQTAVMNWGLLHATFPKAIPQVHPHFRKARVQVQSDATVVLVLSCRTACRWEVTVKPGGKVVGVVLCGYRAQELEVFENPVEIPTVYRAREWPDGSERRGPGVTSFDGYDKTSEEWPAFVAGVKDVTGKDFKQLASFQGRSTPGPKDEPFLIPPKK
jgi:hypothetical protein